MYRAAWTLVALPLLVAAFTVGRPDPLPKPPLPPSFDGETAAALARELAGQYPYRSPGSQDAAGAARWVAEQLAQYNLNVELQRVRADIPGLGEVPLTNVIARPLRVGPERSPEVILVLAHRDNLDVSAGLDDNASGTAALIELARNLSAVTVSHTIVFASTDGGAYGGHGAAAVAALPELSGRVLAVVNLDALAGGGGPRLEFAGDRSRSPAGVLIATAEATILEQAQVEARFPSSVEQLLDLAFPFSLYEQAPFLGQRISAVTLTSAGSRPPPPDAEVPLDADALEALGRSAQALITSVDTAAEVARGTDSFVYLGGRYIRGFALQFVFLVALIPVLLTTIDLFARLRRRGVRLAPALRSYRSRLLAWCWAGGLAAVFTAVGLFPNGAPRPISPDTDPAQQWPFAAIAGLVALSAAGWFVARVRLIPREPVDRSDELAGHLVAMLALCSIALALAVTNAFSLVFVLPSLHAWLWAPHARNARLPTRIGLYALGFLGPVGLVVSFAVRFDLGLDAPWYLATLFTVGYAPLVLFITFIPWAAAAGQVGAMLFGRYAPYPEGSFPGLVRGRARRALYVNER